MGKRLDGVNKTFDKSKMYSLLEAVDIVKKCATAKFDETVELHVRLGIDPKQSDQQIRGTVPLPHGTGKSRRVAVITKGDKAKEAETAGADLVGANDLVDVIATGKMDFDILVASPDMMKDLSKLGKVLGPRGLMPNPKSGTVTLDIGRTVRELKAGRVEFKNDDFGIVHLAVGKKSFDSQKLADNAKTVLAQILKMKPSASKGIYMMSVTLSSTMGPGVSVDPNQKF